MVMWACGGSVYKAVCGALVADQITRHSRAMSMQQQTNREDSDQLIRLDVTIQVTMGQLASAINGDQPLSLPATATLCPLSDQRFRPLLAEQDRQQTPDMQTAAAQHETFDLRMASRQPHCSRQLRFPEPVQQSGSVTFAFQLSDERQEVAMPESSSPMISREGQFLSQVDVLNFLNNPEMLEMYYDIWSRSSNGHISNIDDVISQYSKLPDKIIAIDAVCTHVEITLHKASTEHVVGWLRKGITMCNGIPHAIAKVLLARLKRRIACIYFRQNKPKEARQEITGITSSLKDCEDVGIVDTYWLMAWIKVFEVSGNESELADASQDILHNAGEALKIAQKLPNEKLKKVYYGRISCNFACLKLLLASCRQLQCGFRETLKTEANELVNETLPCALTKRDRSLWCRAKLWLSLVCKQPSEQILNQIIAECRGVDGSNIIFTVLSVYHCTIERALCGGGGGGGSGNDY